MRAVVLHEPGGVDRMSVETLPRPEATEDRVLVKVRACGVAHRDVIERQGGHPFLARPIVQGHEFAGEVVEVGPAVAHLRPGDRVVNRYTDSCGACAACAADQDERCAQITEAYGLTTNGGYAEYALLRERGLEPLPDGIDWPEAALIMGALTVGYNNVVYNARVEAGEHVLVTGASGGVGAAAVQSAKHLGATVWTVTSSADKVPALEALGADRVLVDASGRFHEALKAERAEGVDAVIDCVGGPTLRASIRSLRRFGRVAVVGTLEQRKVELDLGYVVVNAIGVLGSNAVSRKALREVMDLVAQKKLTARVDRTLPLEAAAEAHTLVEQRAVVGRVVLVPHDA